MPLIKKYDVTQNNGKRLNTSTTPATYELVVYFFLQRKWIPISYAELL